MYPAGHMSGSYYYHPCSGGGYAMPGYNYNPYFAPYPYEAMSPVMPPYHFGHHSPMPGVPVNSHPARDACFPTQYPLWRPPSSCCCVSPCHYPHGNPMVVGARDDTKSSNEPEDVKSMRPVMWSNGSNTSQPQVVWIPHVNNMEQQDEDNGPKTRNSVGQWIPVDLNKLATLGSKDINKPVNAGDHSDYPFPIILMPNSPGCSKAASAKDRISEIEEKPLSSNIAEPLKLLRHDVKKDVPSEPVKTVDSVSDGIQTQIQSEKIRIKDIPVKEIGESNEKQPPVNVLKSRSQSISPTKTSKTVQLPNDSVSDGIQAQIQNENVRVKDIPVKHIGESNEKKSSINVLKSRSRSVSPAKTSKLPPVCLRVDPLPRKKNGNGTPKPSSSPEKNLQQPQETDVKTHNYNADKAKNVKEVEYSSEERPKDNSVFSCEENANCNDMRESVPEGELTKSVQPETPIEHEEGIVMEFRKSMSEETAAVLIQSVYRGYEERKWQSLNKLRQIAKVRHQISSIKDRVQTLENDADMKKEEFERQKLIIGETIMSHLLTLDTIQGLHPNIRDVRKSVARELISLQERLDLLHAQRSKESEHVIDHSERESADNVNAKEDTKYTVNANSLQENNHEEGGDKEIVNVYDGKVKKEDNAKEIVDSACIELHQDVARDEIPHMEPTVVKTESFTNVQAKALLVDEVDREVKAVEGEVQSSVEENAEGIVSTGEQSLEGGNNFSTGDFVSEHEPTELSDVFAGDAHTVKTTQTILGGEVLNPFINTISVENGEILSRELSRNGEQVKSNNESEVMECGEALEHDCNHVEEQPDQQQSETQTENLSEAETEAANTSAPGEIALKMEEFNHDPAIISDYKFGNTEILASEESPAIETEEDLSINGNAWNVNLDTSGQANIKVASTVNENDRQSDDTEIEQSVVTDNGFVAGILEGTRTEAASEDVYSFPVNDEAVIEEHEKPRLSNVSQNTTEDADSVVLAEENDKLKETVRKLLESEKDQLAVITTLNERLRNLEKKLKKTNKKLKLHSGAMIKSAHKNNDKRDHYMPMCSM